MATTFRAITLAIVAALAGGCDLFHSTDWSSRCDENPAAPGCAGAPPPAAASGDDDGGSGDTGDTSLAVTASGAGTTGSGGAGGAGATGGAGTGGLGGASGGGVGGEAPDDGRCSTCAQVGAVVLDGSSSPDPSTLCPGASQDAWDAVYQCICQQKCDGACDSSACQLEKASSQCQQCAANNCLSQLLACDDN